MKHQAGGPLVFLLLFTILAAGSPQAHADLPFIRYDVNRAFSGATLTGTIDIPLGNYTIQNEGPSPFLSVDLTLTVNGNSYALNNVLTDYIYGSGQFSIMASTMDLIFVASGNGANPADLIFSDNLDPAARNRYVIGSNSEPKFEAAYTYAGNAISHALDFPVTFGVVVPEPTTLSLLALGSLALVMVRRRR